MVCWLASLSVSLTGSSAVKMLRRGQSLACEKLSCYITPIFFFWGGGASLGFQSCTECSWRSCCTSIELYTAHLPPISVSCCTPTHPAVVSRLLIAACFRFPRQRLSGTIGLSAELVHPCGTICLWGWDRPLTEHFQESPYSITLWTCVHVI